VTPGYDAPRAGHGLIPAIDSAVRAIDNALANDMQGADGEPAASHLQRLRIRLLAMRDRGAVDADELRHMIRSVASWAPQDDVSLLGSLGAIARARGNEKNSDD
jgi:hypothetical protein